MMQITQHLPTQRFEKPKAQSNATLARPNTCAKRPAFRPRPTTRVTPCPSQIAQDDQVALLCRPLDRQGISEYGATRLYCQRWSNGEKIEGCGARKVNQRLIGVIRQTENEKTEEVQLAPPLDTHGSFTRRPLERGTGTGFDELGQQQRVLSSLESPQIGPNYNITRVEPNVHTRHCESATWWGGFAEETHIAIPKLIFRVCSRHPKESRTRPESHRFRTGSPW